MSYQKEREDFIALLAREGISEDEARGFLRDANTAQRLAAESCSYEWADTEEHRKREERADARILERAIRLGLAEPVLQGDPRGACVKLVLPSGKTNDWGREGICVPTRDY